MVNRKLEDTTKKSEIWLCFDLNTEQVFVANDNRKLSMLEITTIGQHTEAIKLNILQKNFTQREGYRWIEVDCSFKEVLKQYRLDKNLTHFKANNRFEAFAKLRRTVQPEVDRIRCEILDQFETEMNVKRGTLKYHGRKTEQEQFIPN